MSIETINGYVGSLTPTNGQNKIYKTHIINQN